MFSSSSSGRHGRSRGPGPRRGASGPLVVSPLLEEASEHARVVKGRRGGGHAPPSGRARATAGRAVAKAAEARGRPPSCDAAPAAGSARGTRGHDRDGGSCASKGRKEPVGGRSRRGSTRARLLGTGARGGRRHGRRALRSPCGAGGSRGHAVKYVGKREEEKEEEEEEERG